MALKLRKGGAPSNQPPLQTPEKKVERTDWFGRPTPPPAPGSDYDEFVMWASYDSPMPHQDEIDLAITLWMGLVPVDYQPSESPEYSGPRM